MLPAMLRQPLRTFSLLLALMPLSSQALTIGTGPLNGVYYPTGGALCRILNTGNTLHGDRCTVLSTQGSLANLNALATGKIQLALVQSDVLHQALLGTGPFTGQGPDHQLRSLFRLYQESLTLLVAPDSGISEFADIKGKRVSLGNHGAGDQLTARALISAMNLQPAPLIAKPVSAQVSPQEGLCDGSLDAAFVVEGHPSLAIGDLINRCKVRVIPIEGEQIDQWLTQHPTYQRSRIAANLYPGQTSAINNIGVSAELVALASLPDPIVRTVRDTLLARVKQFSRLHPALSKVTTDQLHALTELPLHEGMLDAAPTPLAPSSAPLSAPSLETQSLALPATAKPTIPALTEVVPTSGVPTSTVPTSTVLTSAVPTSAEPTTPRPDQAQLPVSAAAPLQP
ncbi:MAG: TAXI family TRAP transporter solute-binding subunit [Aeromonas sp.]